MSCSYCSLAATGLQVIQCESGPEGQPLMARGLTATLHPSEIFVRVLADHFIQVTNNCLGVHNERQIHILFKGGSLLPIAVLSNTLVHLF